ECDRAFPSRYGRRNTIDVSVIHTTQVKKDFVVWFPDRTSRTTKWTRASSERRVLSSHRLISTSQLHTLPCFHIWPINPVVWLGASHPEGYGSLILRPASRLDAFSGYPSRT